LLELTDVHAYYGESHILHGVSLGVAEGETVALLGRNGMGKTTTMRAIAGLTPPRSGSVRFDGDELAGMRPHKIGRRGVALVPQGRKIFPSLSVRENLTVAARGGRGDDQWDLARVYETFPILERRASVKGTLLSGGEQQMLAIARALMTNPRLVLMDEPSEGLAPIVIEEIGQVIRDLAKASLSILIVEQNLALALSVADRAYILSKGAVVHEDSAERLARDEDAQSRHLGAAAQVATAPARRADIG
jgi:branched-chain amino acid transport system ATP-binding protein